MTAGTPWETLQETVVFPPNLSDKDITRIRKIRITIRGKDTSFWAGFYGPKFARCCLKMKLIPNPTEIDVIVTQEHVKKFEVMSLPDIAETENNSDYEDMDDGYD